MTTAANSGSAVPWQKRVADFCTAARGPLGVALVWLGFARGKDGIELALLLLLAAATLDTLDGYFARLSQYPHQTWLGAHDLTFDVGFSVAMLLYLALAGYFSPYLAAGYAGFWILVFGSQVIVSNTLAVFFQGPIYIGAVLAAVIQNITLMVWITVWLGVMLTFAGNRFFHVRVPAFFDDLFAGRWSDHRSHNRKRAEE